MANLNTDLLSPEQAIEATVVSYNSKDAIEKINGLEVSASEIDRSVNLAHPSVSKFLNKVRNKTSSVSILVNSDSTGNESGEWVYLLAQWMATEYPEYTIRYRVWNTSTNAYDAPVNINNGTGTYFIDIWNFAVSGATPKHILGKYFINGCVNINNTSIYTDVSSDVDLIITNHGHNIYVVSQAQAELSYGDSIESILTIHNNCSVIGIKQNPRRDDNGAEPKHRAVESYILRRGFALANVYEKFIALNKSPSLYADNIHPSTGLGNNESPTGTRLFLESITDILSKTETVPGIVFNSKYNNTKKNMLPNGDFSTWTLPSSFPDGWTGVYATPSQDTTIFENINSQKSLKVTLDGTGSAFIEYTVPSYVLNLLKGKTLTLSVRSRINSAGADTNTGLVRVITSSNSEIWTSAPSSAEYDGFFWNSLYFKFKTTDTSLKIRLYCGAGVAGSFINYDRIVLTRGVELTDII